MIDCCIRVVLDIFSLQFDQQLILDIRVSLVEVSGCIQFSEFRLVIQVYRYVSNKNNY